MTDQPNPPGPTPPATPLPPELQAAGASKEDRTMAMIAHLLGLVGFVGPLVLYLVKKDSSSKYVQYHMKQSLFYQVALIVVFILGFIAAVGSLATGGLLAYVLFIPVLGLAGVGAVVYVIIGAMQVNAGKDFEYYWVGGWVRSST